MDKSIVPTRIADSVHPKWVIPSQKTSKLLIFCLRFRREGDLSLPGKSERGSWPDREELPSNWLSDIKNLIAGHIITTIWRRQAVQNWTCILCGTIKMLKFFLFSYIPSNKSLSWTPGLGGG